MVQAKRGKRSERPEREEATESFRALLESFTDAMLVTRTPDGEGMHARPMRIARCDERGDLWFATRLDSAKVPEINSHPDVLVTLQGSDRYLSVEGHAQIVAEDARIKELWSETWRPWFPDGPATPELALIQVRAERGELWDYSSLASKLRFLFEAGKAYVAQREIDSEAVRNEKVSLEKGP